MAQIILGHGVSGCFGTRLTPQARISGPSVLSWRSALLGSYPIGNGGSNLW
jgi:hypothetical protein